MTNEQTTPKPRKDRIAKWVFLGLAIVAAILVWMLQRDPAILTGWETDLPKALADGKAQARPVLIFFHDAPMNDTCRRLVKHFDRTQSLAAYKRYHYIRVHVGTDTSSEVARQWKLKGVPTLVVVGAGGKELGRYHGFIPEAEFYGELLPLAKPGSATAPAADGPHP